MFCKSASWLYLDLIITDETVYMASIRLAYTHYKILITEERRIAFSLKSPATFQMYADTEKQMQKALIKMIKIFQSWQKKFV